jgi:hypothetical protein
MLALLGLALGTAWSAAAHARAFQVACNVVALNEALQEASTNSEEDVVSLAPSCLYALTGILIAYPDNGFPLTIEGAGSTISGQSQRTAFLVNTGATLYLNDLTVTQGKAGPTASGDGGAIYNAGSLTLTRSTVSNSQALTGGGIFNANGNASLTLIQSSVTGNAAGAHGGGIRNLDGRLTLIDSTVSGNSTGPNGIGGGIYNDDSAVFARASATLSNCTISGNSAQFGAGVFNANGKVTVSHCTLADNTTVGGGTGGAVFHTNDTGNARLKLGNSILANTQGGGLDCARNPSVATNVITTTGDNLIEDASCLLPGAWSGDPKLGSLTGSPGYRPLLPGSPVIDLAAQSANCAGVDPRGALRPQDGNADGTARCDLGAYEAP